MCYAPLPWVRSLRLANVRTGLDFVFHLPYCFVRECVRRRFLNCRPKGARLPYHIILGIFVLVVGSAVAPPLARSGRKSSGTASFPPLGYVDNSVIRGANGALESVNPRFPDIEGVANPGDQVDGHVRELEWKDPVYRLAANCKLNSVSPAVRTHVLKKLAAANFAPFDRLQYFAWCNREHLVVVGWSGDVESFTNKPDGLFIQVRMTPQLRQTGVAAPGTLDAFTEFYLLDKHLNLKYVGGQANQQVFRQSLIEF